jgi:subtilase family serine protease
MKSPRPGRLLALAAGVLACAAMIGATSAVGASGRSSLSGTKPSWTAKAPKAGNVSAAQQVSAKVWLAPRNAAQLKALAQAVSDPNSAQYGQFISSADYAAQFAPTAAQVDAVTQWLTGAGLQVTATGPDNHYLAVSGSTAAINSAFGTTLAMYTINGKQWQAPSSTLSVPSTLAGSVLSVSGLTQFGHMVKPADLGAPAAFVNSTECSSFYGQTKASAQPKFNGQTLPYAPCGYTPSQLRGAYDVGPGGGNDLGKGSTVAITDAFDASTLEQDANTYSQRHGDKKFAPKQFDDRSAVEGASSDPDPIAACGGNGWYGEQTLDIEAVHAMAQGANVLYYGAASCYDDDLLASLSRVVADNDASIVTNSWGEPTFVNIPEIGCTPCATIDDSLINAYESVFQQGAAQGIGFYFSSGDNGDELDAWGIAHPDWPTEDPWVTSVGGTSLAVDKTDNRSFETGWGTSKWSLSGNTWVNSVPFLYGAGGGFTYLPDFDFALFDRPAYQNGVVQSSTPGRAVPDISADADPTTGMLVGETQDFSLASRFGPAGVHYGEYRIGGTSLASPLIAGMQAVAQGKKRIGFANPLIYSLAGTGVYYDVTPQGDVGNVRSDFVNGQNADNGLAYSVRTFDQDSSLTTGPGWDDVSGVGSPTGKYFDLAKKKLH